MMKNLNKKIEDLFDRSENSVSLEELKKSFVLQVDNHQIENLSYIFSKELAKKEIPVFFTQLSSFFEIGFLIEKTRFNHSRIVQLFFYSHHFHNLQGLQSLKLPQPELFQVLSTNAQTFLKHFQLLHFDSEKKMSAFLIRISESQSFLLMSSLAEPWLQLRIEALQKTLMKVPFE